MLAEPKFMSEGYAYLDGEKWCIKEDAPDWAKKEFEEFFGLLEKQEDDNGIITNY